MTDTRPDTTPDAAPRPAQPARTRRRTIPRPPGSDVLALILLAFLCWLFYWRLFTGNPRDQLSLVEGDFSGQFVAFAHYQAVRLGAGEVPLWNPYNLGGHPFLADTQAAVFYPPRLITIAVLNASGGSTPARMYDALQREMAAHTLVAALGMYIFLRRLMRRERYTVVASLLGTITFAFGGFLTSYPQLQLAIIEAAVWLPFALLGVHEGLRERRGGWPWFGLAGAALGLSLLAGHPQTTLLFGYLTVGYMAWRTWMKGRPFGDFLLGALIVGGIGFGLAAVQVLPGLEYLSQTTRGALSFDAKGNGFPFYDLLQIVFPGLFSLWSPLYFGVLSLMLVIYSAYRLRYDEMFWFGVLAFAVALSFGRNTILYDITYNLLPGFSLFRGQERSAYIVAVATAVLAALGTADILRDTDEQALPRRFALIFSGVAAGTFSLAIGAFVEWLAATNDSSAKFQTVMYGVFITLLAAALLINIANWRNRLWLRVRAGMLVGLLLFELFSFSRANPNLEAVPAAERLPRPPVLAALADPTDPAGQPIAPYRIDGLGENFGTLYGAPDIGGISPLRLTRVDSLLSLPNRGRMWDVFAVRYVLTPDRELPVPSRVVMTEQGPTESRRVHELRDPRPFARLVYRAWIEPDDAQARGILSEPAFAAADTVVLAAPPPVELAPPAEPGRVTVTAFAPERITLRTESPVPALLNLALVYYPGWVATIDGQPTPLQRADIGMTALVVPAGDHTVQLTFEPLLYRIGGLISLVTLVILGLGAVGFAIFGRRSGAVEGGAGGVTEPRDAVAGTPAESGEQPSGRAPA